MWATIEKLRMRARLIAIQSSTSRTCPRPARSLHRARARGRDVGRVPMTTSAAVSVRQRNFGALRLSGLGGGGVPGTLPTSRPRARARSLRAGRRPGPRAVASRSASALLDFRRGRRASRGIWSELSTSGFDLGVGGDYGVGVEGDAGGDFGVGADGDVRGDHAVAQDGAGADADVLPQDGA